MEDSRILKSILLVLGALLVGLGGWRLVDPVGFFANSGLSLAAEPGLLSEARATGGVVAGFGLVIVTGVFVKTLTYTSTLAAVVLFFGFGLARLLGVAIDGHPGAMVIQGVVFEFVLGAVALAALLKFRHRTP